MRTLLLCLMMTMQAVKEALNKDGNVIFARTKEFENAWHIAALAGSLEVRGVPMACLPIARFSTLISCF